MFYNSYFPRCFFVNYECNEPLICSIKSKSAILPFRNINALEKRGGTCVLNISSQRDDVLVTIECEQSCNSEFRLPKMDNNLFEVEFHTDLPNHIAMDVKSMQNYISGYSSSIDFVTIKVSSEGVHFESFAFGPKNMMSRMELAPTLFDEFHITSEEEIAITFCYKSFRTFLSSIECKNSLCRIYLDKSNQPLFMLVKSGDHESRMIASCLDVSDGSTNSSLESSNPLTVAHSTKS